MIGDGEDLMGGVFHLISAHEVAPEGRWRLHPAYYALCGARVRVGSLQGSECPNECGCEDLGAMAHCQACLREALRQNRLAGVEADDGSMVAVRG